MKLRSIMKNIFISICLLVSYIGTSQNVEIVQEVFKSGNAHMLQTELANEVQVCIGDDVQYYTKKETISALNKWFTGVGPDGFKGRMMGESDVKYFSGDLSSSKGVFRVFVYFANENGEFEIDEIRIGKAK